VKMDFLERQVLFHSLDGVLSRIIQYIGLIFARAISDSGQGSSPAQLTFVFNLHNN